MRPTVSFLVFLLGCGTAERQDDSACPTWYPDADGDQFGADAGAVETCDPPAGYTDVGGDCDDGSTAVTPVATEVCGGVDDDCDGKVDDADDSLSASTTRGFYPDADGDGHGAIASASVAACAAPEGYAEVADDCDDAAADVFPGAAERCGGVDHDCDGEADDADAVDRIVYGHDADGDGYGDAADTVEVCAAPEGYVADLADCDDTSGAIHPDAPELCDDVDSDCDGGTRDADAGDAGRFYPDVDGDGYGDAAATAVVACDAPADHVADHTDCDDAAFATHPGADEWCNSVDSDCDGESLDSESVDAGTWYADADGDGYGDADVAQTACAEPAGAVADDDDCDDATATTNPGADETCNDVDDDCDGAVDIGAVDRFTWYFDADGDGYGTSSYTTTACDAPPDYAAADGDCDTTDADTYPGAPDACDGVDHDCDGTVDEDDSIDADSWFLDADGDGFGDAGDATDACTQPSGRVLDASDCDDTDASVNPDAEETCDGADDDCDGAVDDAAVDFVTWYTDADGDGYGDEATVDEGCTAAAGSVAVGGDCDDTDAAVSPGEAEVCGDLVDDDCDGLAPECFDGAMTSPADADLVLSASVAGRHLGAYLGVADFDGDGEADLLAGAFYNSTSGGVTTSTSPAWWVPGPVASPTTLSTTATYADLGGTSAGTEPGVLTEHDLSGDGVADLVLANYATATNGYTRVCVVELPTTDLSVCTSSLTWGTANLETLGLGDLDGDGDTELVGHAYRSSLVAKAPDGSSHGTIADPAHGSVYWSGSSAVSDDLFGTGLTSIAAAARHVTSVGGYDEVYVFDGLAAGAALAAEDADLVLTVGTDNEDLQLRAVPDTDGDGFADLVVYPAYGVDSYVFSDAAGLGSTATAADTVGVVTSSSSGSWTGTTIATLDADRDGLGDLFLGSHANAAYLVYGPIAGTVDVTTCTPCATITDTGAGSSVLSVWAGDDLFGNGYPTVAVRKTYANVFGGEDGVVSIFEVGG